MFDFFKYNFRHKCTGLIACAVGIGILLVIVLPPIGWMIACALCLIIGGIIWFENC